MQAPEAFPRVSGTNEAKTLSAISHPYDTRVLVCSKGTEALGHVQRDRVGVRLLCAVLGNTATGDRSLDCTWYVLGATAAGQLVDPQYVPRRASEASGSAERVTDALPGNASLMRIEFTLSEAKDGCDESSHT